MSSRRRRKSRIDHNQCECMVLQRGPHWGLFCQPHGKYIKWLGVAEQAELRKMDIPWISQSESESASQ